MTEAVLEKVDWRAQAKELGIRMYQRTKVDVLADIEAASKGEPLEPEANLTVTTEEETEAKEISETIPPGTIITRDGADVDASVIETVEVPPTVIEPIAEHQPWKNDGEPTEVEGLMRRVETLENRLNSVIEAISKSKKVKGL